MTLLSNLPYIAIGLIMLGLLMLHPGLGLIFAGVVLFVIHVNHKDSMP